MLLIALLVAASNPPLAPLTPHDPPPAAANTPPLPGFDPLAKGSVGLSFSLPGDNGSANVGVTYLLSDNFAARFDFGLDATFAPSGTPATFDLGLALRWYQLRQGPVAVFFSPSLTFGRSIQGAGAAEFLTFGGAAGVEYFFGQHLSAGGQLGVALNLNNIGGDTGSVGVALTTATSGLFASVYF
jgi:hypothetical protein